MGKINVTNQATPSTPATGDTTLFVDSADKHLKQVDDTGTVTDLTNSGVTDHTLLSNIGTNTHAQIDSHISNVSNPHSVTAAQAGAAPSSHVGSGGSEHADATTSVSGFMSGADKAKLDGVATGANNYSHPNHSGDVTSVGDGAQTITNNAVTNAKAAQMATSTIKGRATAGTGNPEDLTATQVRTILNVADGAQVNPTVRNYWISAGAMIPRATNPAQPSSNEYATNLVNPFYYNFDSTTAEYVNFMHALPQDWNLGTVKFKPYWTAASGSGTVQFDLSARAIGDNEAIDQAYGTAQVSLDTLQTANNIHIGPTSPALTIAGTLTDGKLISWRIQRNVATDTLAVDARLLGIMVEYTVTGSNPTAF